MAAQAQAPREIERVVEEVKKTTIQLDPRDLEVLTAATARRLLYRIHRTLHPQPILDVFIDEANEIVNEFIFITYLAGMKKAAREFKREHASPSQQDWELIEAFRRQYREDVDRLIRDMVNDAIHDRSLDVEYYHARSDLIVQMAIWTVYNRAKLSVYRVENKRQAAIAQAANYAYRGWFMIQTAADEGVCELCASMAGDMTQDIDSLPLPPYHVFCRCQIVAIPTVSEYEKQLAFKEEYQTEQVISESI
jgi:hypothetical protein